MLDSVRQRGIRWLAQGTVAIVFAVGLMYGMWANPRSSWAQAFVVPYFLLPYGVVALLIGLRILGARRLSPLIVVLGVLATILALAVWTARFDRRSRELFELEQAQLGPPVLVPALGSVRVVQFAAYPRLVETGEPLVPPESEFGAGEPVYVFIRLDILDAELHEDKPVSYVWRWKAPSGEIERDQGIWTVPSVHQDPGAPYAWQRLLPLPPSKVVRQSMGTWVVEFLVEDFKVARFEFTVVR